MPKSSKLRVYITNAVTQCDCCYKTHLKRTVCIQLGLAEIHLGVVCASNYFSLDMRGNPFYAAKRLFDRISVLSRSDFESILEEIEDNAAG